jgi:dolichyl-phosphate-mannose-protein mannosyltransferase
MTAIEGGQPERFPLSIFVFAVLVRVLVPVTAYLLTSDPQVFHSPDTNSYIQPTQELLSDGTFSVNGKTELHRTPGYSLILAPGIAANHVEVVTIALQILLSASSVWLVFLISLEIFSSYRAALIAAWLYAIEPLSVLYTSKLLTETWFATLLLLSMYFLIRHLKSQRTEAGPVTKWLVISAAALAGATYVRPVSYFLPVCIFMGWVLAILLGYWTKRVNAVAVRLTSAIVFIIVSMSLIAAWQVRNYVQTGYSGFSGVQDANLYFYLGAATLASIEGRSYYDVQDSLGHNNEEIYFSKHPDQKTWPEAQVLRFQGEEGRRILFRHPLTYLKIYSTGTLLLVFDPGAVELLKLFKRYEEGGGLLGAIHDRGIISVTVDLFERNPLFFWSNVVFALYLFPILGFAVVGLARRTVGTRTGVLLLLGVIAYLIAISAGPQSYGRFRYPIMPFLCILAGIGMRRQKAVDMAPQRNLWVKDGGGGANFMTEKQLVLRSKR